MGFDWRSRRFGKRLLLPILAILVLLCPSLAEVASAGVNVWTSNGPKGGGVAALAIDPATPSTVYAGTSGGILKSTNGGDNWNAINAGLASAPVSALAIDPSTPATLYAGTSAGVFKSTNGGGSWSAINAGLTIAAVSILAIDPSAPATLYAGTAGGLFKSTDGGASWSSINNGLPSTNGGPSIKALAIDPKTPATLYAAISGAAGTSRGIFKSTDGGGGWSAANNGLTNGFAFAGVVFALAIDPKTPATLYAGISGAAGTSRGVFKSTDGGGNWSAMNDVTNDVHALAIDPKTPATLYAATVTDYPCVIKSTDGGSSWIEIETGLDKIEVSALAIDPVTPSTLYAGTVGGVFKSINGGDTWTINTALTNGYIVALAIDPKTPATLYAGTSGGVMKSTDGGGSWGAVNAGLTHISVVALAIDPATPATLYAGTLLDDFRYSVGPIFKSTNAGENWSPINIGLTPAFCLSLAIDPSTPATLYAGTSAGVFKSTNGGASWSAINSGLPLTYGYFFPVIPALAIDRSAPATLYAGTPVGVFKSTDGGDNWNAINSGLPSTNGGQSIHALAIDPSAPATLYAGTAGGVFKSTDGGGGWNSISTGLTHTDVWGVAIDPASPAVLYAGTYSGGVFKSTNSGGSWTEMNAGLTDTNVNALAIDPLAPARLYAGTYGGGVFDYESVIEPCVAGPTTLCLNGGRFTVTTQWATRDSQSGSGHAAALSADTGYFTFFDPANVEVVVKVLNGCSVNGSFWLIAGGLTDVSVVMTVTDSQTGTVKTYTNPQGTPFQPIQDTAFATCASGTVAGTRASSASAATPLLPPTISESFGASEAVPCIADATTLCLNNSRYKVQTQWLTRDGGSGPGQAIGLSGDTGTFWFFSSSNIELVIKVLNGCGVNSRYWTFAAGLTDVNVILTVTDTQTGAARTYTNPQGIPFAPIQDTSAFASCP